MTNDSPPLAIRVLHSFRWLVMSLGVTVMLPSTNLLGAEPGGRSTDAASIITAQRYAGQLKLVQVLPDNRIIFVYFDADGTVRPVQLVDASGQVAEAEDVGYSSVVWVTIDANGYVKPLQVSGTGQLQPARIDAKGKPLLPGTTAPATKVFAAQIAADGKLHGLLFEVDAGFLKVTLSADNVITLHEELAPATPGPGPQLAGSISLDNSGNSPTGLYRANAFVQMEGLWGTDHSTSFFVSNSITDPDALVFAAVGHSVPMTGWIDGHPDRLGFSGSYGRVNYQTQEPAQPEASKFAIRSYSGSVDYLQYLSVEKSASGSMTSHSIVYGASYDKSWTRDFGFGQDDHSSIVRLPLSVRYNFKVQNDWLGLLSIGSAYVRNLPLASAGEGEDYRKNRVGADPNYDKVTADLVHEITSSSGWSTLAKMAGQYTDEALIQSEAIALGGLASVRGLETAKSLGDIGAKAQFEILAPDLASNEATSIRPSIFIDGGWVKRVQREPSLPPSETAIGSGLGLRVTSSRGLFANVAAAWLVGGTAEDRYSSSDGRFQLYLNAGVNF